MRIRKPSAKTAKKRLLHLTPTTNRLATLIQKERRSPVRARLTQRYKAWRHGFLSESPLIYGAPARELGDYLSDFARIMRTPRINGAYNVLLDDKLVFYLAFKDQAPTPRALAVVRSGRVRGLADSAGVSSLQELIGAAREREGLVVRRVRGGGGDRVLIARSCDGGFRVDDRVLSPGELSDVLRTSCTGDHLVTEFVEQAPYSATIFPQTTNTIRLVTMLDPQTLQPFVPIAVHRFGTRASVPVDSWGQGGLSAEVDIETGRLSEAATSLHDGGITWYSAHPDTGAPIEGTAVPRWSEVRDAVLRLAARNPILQYVGWDVVITRDRFAVLEGNSYSGVHVLQVHRPLLRDPRVRSFFKHHGVIH